MKCIHLYHLMNSKIRIDSGDINILRQVPLIKFKWKYPWKESVYCEILNSS